MDDIEQVYVSIRDGAAEMDTVTSCLCDLTDTSLHRLLEVEDAIGEPFMTLVLRNYGVEACLEIYDTLVGNNTAIEELYRYNVTTNGSSHPIDWCFRLHGLDKTFEFIERAYERRFSLLYDIQEYSDPSSIVDHLLLTSTDTLMLIDMLAKYNVTKEEFDFSIISG